ncbi:hypothetical protein [Spiroplasma endosymbiont of Panorpa germanica]|uniref:hypothetical protein n=1 Tax=Spiroplasma endosymbiont of Panorpa germanica TaxID=3066314 RepID=UPI0030CEFD97
MNLLASFVDGRLDNNSPLIMSFIVVIITVILFSIFGTYLLKFKNKKASKNYLNKTLIITVGIVGVIAIALGLTAMILFFNASTVFVDKPDLANNTILFGIIFPALGMIIVMFALLIICAHLFGAGFSENTFELVGENLPYAKVVTVVDDSKLGIVSIVYRQGRSNFKTYKFRKSTVIGQFVLENAEMTGQKIRVESLSIVLSELDAANTAMLATENKLNNFKSSDEVEPQAEAKTTKPKTTKPKTTKPKTTKPEDEKDSN